MGSLDLVAHALICAGPCGLGRKNMLPDFRPCDFLVLKRHLSPLKALRSIAVGFLLLIYAAESSAQTGTAEVRHAPNLNGMVEGSVRQLLGESVTLNGGAVVTKDLLVPGTPAVRLNGKPDYDGTLDGTGAATPANYNVTLNGSASLRNVIRRTDSGALPVVNAPAAPTGSATVTVNSSGQPVSWATLRNLNLNGGVGQHVVPAGSYGDFTANGGSGFTLGVVGSTAPTVYNFQHLTLNGNSQFLLLGPVVVNVANGFNVNGLMGSAGNPGWLTLNIQAGGLTLNGGATFHGQVTAPNGTVIVGGNSLLVGGVISDRLTVNGGGVLRLQAPQATNQPPTVVIITPTNGATFTAPGSFDLLVNAADADGSIVKVEFFQGTIKLGEDSSAPFSQSVAGLGVGSHSFTARATDNAGAAVESAPVTITVDSPNQPPTVSVSSPAGGTVFFSPASITLAAGAVDADGSIAKVEFYQGTTKLGEVASAPYSYVVSGLGAGTYAFSAKAFDNRGASATSEVVTVTVVNPNQSPTVAIVSPADGSVFDDPGSFTLEATASDPDGVIGKVEFFHGTTKLGEDTTAPYQFAVSGLVVDTYNFLARATDNIGSSTDSAPISVTVSHVNDAPVAEPQSLVTNEDTPLAVVLVAQDPDLDPLQYVIAASPSHGLLTGTAPNLTYSPGANFHGTDSFGFKASDGSLESGVVVVTITVNPINDPPAAQPKTLVLAEDTSASVQLTGLDVDSPLLQYVVSSGPSHGTLSGTLPNLVYTPAPDYHGPDAFSYTAFDGEFISSPVLVSMTVTPVNDAPTVASASYVVNEAAAVVIALNGSDVDGDSLTFAVGIPPVHGTLSGSGATRTYTAQANYGGPDSFTFKANDNSVDSAPGTIAITIINPNDAPVAHAQSVQVTEDMAQAVTLVGTDPDGDGLLYVLIAQPAHGALTGTAPNLIYTPAPNYSGPDSFTFKVTDTYLESAPATVSIEVTPVNDPPQAQSFERSVEEGSMVEVTLSGTDAESDSLTYAVLVNPTHGTLSGTAPNLVYHPQNNFDGDDAVTYKVNDGSSDSAPATVVLHVHNGNLAPAAVAQAVIVVEDTPATVVLAGTDPDGDTLHYAIVAPPAHGTLSGTAPNLIFTPQGNYYGIDSFTFRVSDGVLESAPVSVSISITPVNDAPIALPDELPAVEDTPLQFTPTADDPDGDHITYVIVTPPAHGTVTGLLDGPSPLLTYTAAGDFHGVDTMVYKVSDGTLESASTEIRFVVAPVNDAPVGAAQNVTLPEDSSITVTLLGTDVDGDPLVFSLTGLPVHGVLSGTAPNFVYTPEANFNGPDGLTYTVSDGQVTSGSYSVGLNVTPVNDAPSATPQAALSAEDTPLAVVLAGSDIENDALTFTLTGAPAHGSLNGTGANFTYLPEPNYHGPDSFTYTASDGQAVSPSAIFSLTVTPVNDAPEASAQSATTAEDTALPVLLQGTDVDGDTLTYTVTIQPANGTLSGSAPNLTYLPNLNFNGQDHFAFTVSDGQVTSEPAVVSLQVTPVNDTPLVAAQTVATDEDVAVPILFTGSDVDGDLLTVTVLTQPAHGTLSGQSPNFIYTPAANYHGGDAFTFAATDGQATSVPAEATLVINSVNDAPTANAQMLTLQEDQTASIVLTGGDVDGDSLSYAITAQPAHGTLSGTAPNLSYTPATDFHGTDSFQFISSDGTLSSAQTLMQIVLTPVNDAPVASPATHITTTGTPTPIVLTGSDVDGDALTFLVLSQPSRGTLTGTPPSLTYTSAPDYGGFDSFTFRVNDGALNSTPATVQLTAGLPPRSRTYTTNTDFNEGALMSLSLEQADQLANKVVLTSFDAVWVANSAKGTIVKIDPETARVIGEYNAKPVNATTPYPSRLAVDSKGNAWVANYTHNSVVKIGLPENGYWVDRNNNGIVDTSTALGDVRGWVDDNITSAEDESILLYVRTAVSGVRQISIDAEDNVWVTGSSGVWQKFDGRTGALLRTETSAATGGMGGFIANNGKLYSAGTDFLIWDSNSTVTPLPESSAIRKLTWSSALDSKGNLWVTKDGSTTVIKYAPDGTQLGEYVHGAPWAMGIAIDANDHVWVAHSHCGHSVGHLLPDGTLLGSVEVTNHGPVEVSIDRRGRIWVVSSTGVVERINPLGGLLGVDGVTPVGEVDLKTGNLGGALWTYGRFTGSGFGLSTPDGLWSIVYDGALNGTTWGPVVWNALLSNDSRIQVEAALSSDGVTYGPYQSLTFGHSTPTGAGRYLKIRTRLVSATTGESPLLYDLSVGTEGYVPPAVPSYWNVSAGEEIKGNWPDKIRLKGVFRRTGHDFATQPTYAWTQVSGPGTALFNDATVLRPEVQFSAKGKYVLRLTATMGSEVSTSDVTVTLEPYNRAPYANAGYTTFRADVPSEIWLWGEVRDDGLPVGAPVTSQWEQLFGQGVAQFISPNSPTTKATFSSPGVYVLRLNASDGSLTGSDVTTVWLGYDCIPLPPTGLVSWWQASGNGDDHVGGNQAFTERGADYAQGKLGGAFRFDGVNDRVRIFAAPALDVGKGDGFSIEFWVNPDTSRTATVLEYAAGSQRGLNVRQVGSQLDVDFRGANNASHVLSVGSVLPVATWTHVAASYDKATGEARIYVNGLLRASQTIGSFVLGTNLDVNFGGQANGIESFDGLLDEISLYDRAIYADEITTIFTHPAGKRPPVANVPPVVAVGPTLYNKSVNTPVALAGSISDDGQPVDGMLSSIWTQLSGPGVAQFADRYSPQTTATFPASGVYLLELKADDGGFCTRSILEVRVDSLYKFETDASISAWWTGNRKDLDETQGLKLERFNDLGYGPGKSGDAFVLNGINQYGRCVANSSLNLGASSAGLTIEFWAKPGDMRNAYLLHWGTFAGIDGVSVTQSGGPSLVANLTDITGTAHAISAGNVFATNTWVHVAVTYDRTTGMARLYKNGVLATESNLGIFQPRTNNLPLFIGQHRDNTTRFYGALDEITLYARALNLEEVKSIYQGGAIGKVSLDDNQPPSINAGPDKQELNLAASVSLNGTVTDDGRPANGLLSVHWSQLEGPVSAVISNPAAAATTAIFPVAGTYVLQLDADDGLNQGSPDTMVVRAGVTASVNADSALAAWWPANGEVHEVVNGHHDVEFLPRGPAFATGEVGQGFSFNGTDHYGRTPAHADLDLGASAAGLTIEFWAKPGDLRNAHLLHWGTTGLIDGVSVTQSGGPSLVANLTDITGTPHSISIGDVFAANTWVHVAVTYDRITGMARLYKNGVLAKESNLGIFQPRTNSLPLFFGQHRDNTNRFFGVLDEVSLYTRPLALAEVQAIFSAGVNGKAPLDDNQPPVVNAGPDVLDLNGAATIGLNGMVTDDGRPIGYPLTILWSKVEGPGAVSFTNAAMAATTATFSMPGTYVLKLEARDALHTATPDTMVVRVGVTGSVDSDSSLVAWWPANGEIHEMVKGNHDVEFLPRGPAFATGEVGQGFNYNGTDHYGRTPAHSDLDIGASAAGLTIEFWAKPLDLRNAYLLHWGTTGLIDGVSITQSGGPSLVANLTDITGTPHPISVGNVFAANTWVHVAVTYDRTTGMARLYKNGVLATESNLGVFQPRTNNLPLFFGQHRDNTNRFGGVLDEICLYTKPLSLAEVQAIFNAGINGKAPLDDNQPPVVNAGPDVMNPNGAATINLNGTVTDDGRPAGSPLTILWSKVEGPGAVSFTNADFAATTATFSMPGTYVLKLDARDAMHTAKPDTMVVRVGVAGGVTLPSGLAAWWPANGEIHEVVNGNHDVEFLPRGPAFATGEVGQGFSFNGTDHFGRTPAHSDLDIGSSAAGLTIEFWAKPGDMRNAYLLHWGTTGLIDGVSVTQSGGPSLVANLTDITGTAHSISIGNVFANNTWVHVAVTYDRTTGMARLYKNGAMATESNLGIFQPRTTNLPLFFGQHRDNTNRFFGVLDEVSLYTRPLALTEVQALYTAGISGKVPPISNSAPIVNAGPDQTVIIGTALSLAGSVIDDALPEPYPGLTYQWTKVSGPGAVAFSTPTAISTSATFDTLGKYTLRLSASDSVLSGADDVVVDVTAPVPVVALISPAGGSTIVAAAPVALKATATTVVGAITKVEFFIGATKLGERAAPDAVGGSTYTYTHASGFAAGTHSLTAKATSSTAATATSAAVSITAGTYTGSPVVELVAPAEDARISAPAAVTGIVGISSLTSWALDYRLKSAEGDPVESWTQFATGSNLVGTPENGAVAAIPGVLGTFDPTLLLNGIYEIRLRATDASLTTRVAGPITVVVEGNMKVGAFTLAFEDLKLPVASIPITITRTYDSRDARVGDFGPGWRLAVANIRVQKNRNLGAAWWQTPQQGSGIQFYNVESLNDRIVTVTMPDGETHRFRAGAYVKKRPGDPDNASFAVVNFDGLYRFYPLGDTTSTLEPVNAAGALDEHFYIHGTGDQDLRTDDASDPFALTYNPTRFRLTTKDGTRYLLDERHGLLRLEDLNGNTLVLNRDGANRVTSVVSTLRTQPLAPAIVTIHRDATGRVDYIRDLAGQDLDYLYDSSGRLSSFTNREGNITQFRYENSALPNYLTKIIDPRGIVALRSEYDANGRLVKQIDADGQETVFTHGLEATDRFEKIKDRLGHETTFFYDDRGNVVTKLDPLGAQTTYSYYPDTDRVKFETDHYGNTKSMAYDARGNVIVETMGASLTEDPAAPTTGYTTRTTYNALSAPTQITDPDGRVQTFGYAPATNNLLTHTVGTGGSAPATTTYTYKTDGTLDTITDAVGNVTSHAYNYAFTDAAYPGAVKQITVTVTDPAGAPGSDPANATATVLRVTKTVYDAQENMVAQLATRTLPEGGTEDVVTRYFYDTENRLVATVMPDGKVSETRYTSFGQTDKTLLWKSLADYQTGNDALARVTSYGYDNRGNQVSTTHPDGASESSSFDLEGRREWSQDANGNRTNFVYDAVGRLTHTYVPDATPAVATDGPYTETVYDLAGRVTDTYDELRRRTTVAYFPDGTPDAGRRKESIQVLSTGNLVTSYQYDQAGNVRFVTDPRGNTVETRYDEHGRPTTVVYPATDEHPATQSATVYNVLGQRIATTDQEGKVTRYRYDGLGRLVEVRQYLDQSVASSDSDFSLSTSDARVVSTRYTHDELGNQLTQTDARGNATSYRYDSLGRRTKRLLPDNATETLQYDEWGNLWKRTDFKGHTTTFLYDVRNRLTEKQADPTHPSLIYSHAPDKITYGYDAAGNRTDATVEKGSTVLYAEDTPVDERNRRRHKDTALGKLTYAYHDNGLLESITSSNSDGVKLGYRYDGVNRLAYVDDTSGGAAVRTTAYGYNANGSAATVTLPNTVVHTYGYDTLNRLRTLNVAKGVTSLHSYEYKLRVSGHRQQVIENGTRTTTFGYDSLYRLTSEALTGDTRGNNGTVGYGLDKVGNRESRTSSVPSVSTTANTFNSRDWLNTDTYDANGNTRTSTFSSVSVPDVYDFEDRLIIRHKADGSTVNLSYDADGILRQKTVFNLSATLVSATGYMTDTLNPTGYAQVLEERINLSSGTTVKVYAYGSDLISQSTLAPGSSVPVLRYYAYDGLMSVRELTDASGLVTDSYDYDAFGIRIFSAGGTVNDYLYRGERFDADIGQYSLRARFYNQATGRFWNQDTYEGSASDPMSLHKYLYANANPISGWDPSGNWTLGEVMLTAGINATISGIVSAAFNWDKTGADFWRQIATDAGIGVIAGPALGRIAKGLAPLAKIALRPLFQSIALLDQLVLTGGKTAIEKLAVNISRFFFRTTRTYPSVNDTMLGRVMKMMFPAVDWQMHHIVIQQAWSRVGSAAQFFADDILANEGLRRLGNGMWNLVPIPAGLNNALGRHAGGTALFGAIYYGSAAWGAQFVSSLFDESD